MFRMCTKARIFIAWRMDHPWLAVIPDFQLEHCLCSYKVVVVVVISICQFYWERTVGVGKCCIPWRGELMTVCLRITTQVSKSTLTDDTV